MGMGMAKNLLKAGFSVSVYNRKPRAKAEQLAAAGAHIADTPADAARDCRLPIRCFLMMTLQGDVDLESTVA